jgi:hypothetical protein
MKVYVAVHGVYSSQGVGGVYDSPERAIGALREPDDVWTRDTNRQRWGDGREFVTWRNNHDWDRAISIEPFELVTEGPLSDPDEAVVVTDSDDGRSVLRTPEAVQ